MMIKVFKRSDNRWQAKSIKYNIVVIAENEKAARKQLLEELDYLVEIQKCVRGVFE